MVVGQTNNNKRRYLACGDFQLEVAFEFGNTELVGNAEIEGRKAAIAGFEDGAQQRGIEKQTLPLGLSARNLCVALDFKTFAIVEEPFAAGRNVFPEGAELGFV